MNEDLIQRIEQQPLAAVLEYYAACLPHNQRALDFLQRQALSADSALQVGFADRTLGTHLPSNRTKTGQAIRTKLQSVGILKANGRERFRGLVTVPLSDLAGEVTGIYGLRIDPNQGEKETILGSGIFNARALKQFNEIILCQNLLDAWALCGAGHTHAIAAAGIELSAEMFANVSRILLAGQFNHDLFGGKELLQIRFPDDLGAQQYAKKSSSVPDALGQRIRAASWISGGSPDRIKEKPGEEASATELSESTEVGAVEIDTKQKEPVATPLPQPEVDPTVQSTDTETTITLEDRRWRVRGLERNRTLGVLRLNVAVFNDRSGRFHVDQFDLYHARSRRVFLKEAAEETGLAEADLRHDIGAVVMKLEELQQQQLRGGSETKRDAVTLSDAERSEAMGLLKDPRLIDRILDDFETCGIVGERTGNLTAYLIATSRLLERPLGLMIQSSSSAGKTSLLDAALAFMPEPQLVRCSAVTSRSLYYAGNLDLRHKILSISEEEGIREASYALKLLQSEGKLSIVSTAKENGTGRTVVEQHEVRGPVAIMMTTTASDIDPELVNRCLVLSVDEEAPQTELIQQRQREAETIETLIHQHRAAEVRKRHQNAQALLQPLRVVNPYADQLRFTSRAVRNRRDHAKYLALIRTVTLLHQYQRETKTTTIEGQQVEYIEVTREDIGVANLIADAVLGTSIDELSPPTRKLLRALFQFVHSRAEASGVNADEIHFTRRELRESLGWSTTQLRHHLQRLCHHEYVVPLGPPGRGRLTHYQLLFDGRGYEGQRAVCGLVDPKRLTDPTTEKMSD